jgi:hypothetical protein
MNPYPATIGAIADWIAGELVGLLSADSTAPVAAEQAAFNAKTSGTLPLRQAHARSAAAWKGPLQSRFAAET